MNCEKCGEPIISNNQFCTNCGAAVSTPQVAYPTEQVVYQAVPPVVDKNKQATTMSIISLVLYFVGPVVIAILAALAGILSEDVSVVISGLTALTRIAAYVLVIIARIQCPQNKFAKVLMWIYIILIILSILLVILLVILIFVFAFRLVM